MNSGIGEWLNSGIGEWLNRGMVGVGEEIEHPAGVPASRREGREGWGGGLKGARRRGPAFASLVVTRCAYLIPLPQDEIRATLAF